jgi:hypothetical protein
MKVLRILGWIAVGIVGLTTLACVLGLAVMWLWNWLIPELFGLKTLSFPQAVGLLVLCHLLFRGHSMGGHARHHGPRDHDRRARFRNLVHGYLGKPAASCAETEQSTS